MSDETIDRLDEVLEHAPVEDYSGDDTTNAPGTVEPPRDDKTPAAGGTATEPTTADATKPPAPDSAREG